MLLLSSCCFFLLLCGLAVLLPADTVKTDSVKPHKKKFSFLGTWEGRDDEDTYQMSFHSDSGFSIVVITDEEQNEDGP
jgi:hypothetical protein